MVEPSYTAEQRKIINFGFNGAEAAFPELQRLLDADPDLWTKWSAERRRQAVQRDVHRLFRCTAWTSWRPPDWCARLAAVICDHGDRHLTDAEDTVLIDAVRYLRWRADAHGVPAESPPCSPAIAAAFSIAENPDARQRWELEARILARQRGRTIAKKTGLPHDVVVAFHDLYFDVTGRLNEKAFREYDPFDMNNREPDTTNAARALKSYAYNHGARHVDELLRYYQRPPVIPEDLMLLDVAGRKELCSKLRIRLELQFLSPQTHVARARSLPRLREASQLLTDWEAGLTASGGLPIDAKRLQNLMTPRTDRDEGATAHYSLEKSRIPW